jgi:PTH1 family peptidyl-tRNA hydrolase
MMKLIVGLGNPGGKYEDTRHNVGFRTLDELSRRWRIELTRRRFSGLSGSGTIRDQKVLLLKPMTYMNLSGRSVREAMTFHKLAPADLLVVLDDMALPLGRLRLRPAGSAGGHNGLTSVIAETGGEAFARLRIGIESVEGSRMVDHVLGSFTAEERPQVDQAIVRAADAVECWLSEGIDGAMNRYNRPEE